MQTVFGHPPSYRTHSAIAGYLALSLSSLSLSLSVVPFSPCLAAALQKPEQSPQSSKIENIVSGEIWAVMVHLCANAASFKQDVHERLSAQHFTNTSSMNHCESYTRSTLLI